MRARVTVPEQVLRAPAPERDFGSILVPLLGGELDEDLVQTAALLVSGEQRDEAAIDRATIEAVWIFRVPMSLPIDAPLPEAQLAAPREPRWRAPNASARSTAASRSRRRRSGRGAPDRRSSRRRGGAASRRSCWPPTSGRAHAPGRCSAAARWSAESTVSETVRYVVERAPLPRDPHGAGARTAAPRRARRPTSSIRPDVRVDRRSGTRRVRDCQACARRRATRCRCSTRTRCRTSVSSRSRGRAGRTPAGCSRSGRRSRSTR